MKETNIKKYFYQILSILAALLLSFSIAQIPVQAAAKPGTVKLSSIKATDYNKINIKWKKTSGATNYIIYYKKAGSNKWIKVKTVDNTKSSYTHTSSKKYPIVVGQKYQYTVKAYNKSTKKYGKYNSEGLLVKTNPQQATCISVAVKDGVVNIDWNKGKGADKYIIYRKTSENGKWVKIATVSDNQYTDTQPVAKHDNYYTVRSYYSKTKAYGSYNKYGVEVYVNSYTPIITPKPTEKPDNPEPTEKPQPTEKPRPTVTPEPEEPTPEPTHRPNAAEINQMAQEVIRLVNIERAKIGSTPLKYHEKLQQAAMVRAKELDTLFSHTRPDGTDSSTATYEAGAGGSTGENIAMGYETPEDVVKGWMNSPGHRTAILTKASFYIGVGIYQNDAGVYFWVQDFADENVDRKCTLTAEANGGIFPDGNNIYSAPFSYKSHVIFAKDIPQPTRDGYKFAGWQSGRFTLSGLHITLNTSIKAIWEPIS